MKDKEETIKCIGMNTVYNTLKNKIDFTELNQFFENIRWEIVHGFLDKIIDVDFVIKENKDGK